MDGHLISAEMFSPTSGALHDCRSVLESHVRTWEHVCAAMAIMTGAGVSPVEMTRHKQAAVTHPWRTDQCGGNCPAKIFSGMEGQQRVP